MTEILTGYAVDQPAVFSYINGRIYCTNDFDRVQVWDGLYTTMRDAGIAAPAAAPGTPTAAAGNCTNGTHLFRYRFLDSTSPASSYRSNASPNLSFTVSGGNGQLTFDIGSSGTDLIRSTDTKVDTIQLEMTAAGGTTFYVVTTVANSATSIVANVTDANLVLNELGGTYDTNTPSTSDLGAGHEQPPLGAIIAQCKDFTFLGGYHARARTVGVTNGSPTVTGTSFSTLWSGRMLRIAGDAVSYRISSATTTTITLATNYAGSTNASASATIFSRTPNRIAWSGFKAGAQMPESWKSTNARDCLNGTGDQLRGMIAWQGDLLLCGRYSMERLIFVDDPAVGELQGLASRFGVWTQQCLVVVDQQLFGWGPNGFWTMRGGGPAWISRPIDTTLAASDGGYQLISRMGQAHGVYDPIQKVIRWFFCKTGETVPREVACYELTGRRWMRAQFRQGIDASVTATDSNGQFLAVLSDSTNGRTWYHQGATDGVPSSSTGAYTAGSGSTTTVINVTDSLPGSNGLAGTMLYQVSSGEERVVASNTSSAITLGSALTTAPAAGAAIYVGAIPWSIETDWWDGSSLADKKRAHLHIHFVPSTAGIIRVRLYKDWETTPLSWTLVDNTVAPHGMILWANGQSYGEMYMDTTNATGFVKIPMFTNWARVLKAKVEVLSPAGTLRLLDVYFAPKRGNQSDAANE